MSNTNNGGPAFPTYQSDHQGKAANTTFEPKGGMTLRDYFAGQALVSTNLGIGVAEEFYSRTAEHCYALADAMLKAREA
jgi:hypothetical protein